MGGSWQTGRILMSTNEKAERYKFQNFSKIPEKKKFKKAQFLSLASSRFSQDETGLIDIFNHHYHI